MRLLKTSSTHDILYHKTFLDFLQSPVMGDVEELELLLIRQQLPFTTEEQVKYETLISEIAHFPVLKSLSLYWPLSEDWF